MIKFEVSRDPRLLEQYYALREQCFREELGIPDFDGSEQEQDRRGHVLIAHKNGRCIGGVRISSELPAEEHFGDLDVDSGACCIWERFVFHPAERSTSFCRKFLAQLIEISHMLDYNHALIISSLRNARFYRLYHSVLGVPFDIHRPAPEFATGHFAGLEHYLSVAHLQKAQQLRMAA
jgi:hypothetical protein